MSRKDTDNLNPLRPYEFQGENLGYQLHCDPILMNVLEVYRVKVLCRQLNIVEITTTK